MIPYVLGTAQNLDKVPRTCGDDPSGVVIDIADLASAPHLRG